MKLENYYKKLPENFVEDFQIDCKKPKTSIIITLLSLVLTIIAFLPFAPKAIEFIKSGNIDWRFLAYSVSFIIASILYIVFHELTHGLLYKIFTHEKLTFGLTLTVAYCGVPNLYVSKKTALFSLLAPFTLFSAILFPLVIFTRNIYIYFFGSILFAVHFGGCIGDLWCTFILLFKYKKVPVLINDTGPKQTFYVLKEIDK